MNTDMIPHSTTAEDVGTPPQRKNPAKRFAKDMATERALRQLGFEFVLETVPIEQVQRSTHASMQFRESVIDPNFLFAIQESMQQGFSVPPIVVVRQKRGFLLVDGHHRLDGARALNWPHVEAYVVTATLAEAPSLACQLNILRNGQGVSEVQRREAALREMIVLTHDHLEEVNSTVRRKIAGTFALTPQALARFVKVELFRRRAERLGLTLPKLADHRHDEAGKHRDSWFMAVAELQDEELVEYWDLLTLNDTNKVRKVAKELAAFNSAKQRQDAAPAVFEQLRPASYRSAREVSSEDLDRRRMIQIRAHCGGLLKLGAEEVLRLSNTSADVAKSVCDVYVMLDKIVGKD